jgi:hypothetical protein
MATDKRGKRSNAARPQSSSKPATVSTQVLDRLGSDELAAVLRSLLKSHPDLRTEAEKIAVEVVSAPSVDAIADEVLTNVEDLDMDDLNSRAGRHSWGYVEPTDAAWELLEQAVEDALADMKRRMELGLEVAAEAICTGIVVGLSQANVEKSDLVLQWAPDFPLEHAGYAVDELIRICPVQKRPAVRDRLSKTLSNLVPEWSEAILPVAENATPVNPLTKTDASAGS